MERYRLIDYEAAKEALARDAKENIRLQSKPMTRVIIDPNYKGKTPAAPVNGRGRGCLHNALVGDQNLSARASGDWPEHVCAENPNEISRRAAIPVAEKPDF